MGEGAILALSLPSSPLPPEREGAGGGLSSPSRSTPKKRSRKTPADVEQALPRPLPQKREGGKEGEGQNKLHRRYDRATVLPRIFAAVATGRSLASVLRAGAERMPAERTFWGWYMEDESVRAGLARAREAGAEAMLDQALDIADGAGEDGAEAVARSKLRIDTRLRYAQLVAPRRYAGRDEDAPAAEDPPEPIDEVLALTRLAALADALQRRLGRMEE